MNRTIIKEKMEQAKRRRQALPTYYISCPNPLSVSTQIHSPLGSNLSLGSEATYPQSCPHGGNEGGSGQHTDSHSKLNSGQVQVSVLLLVLNLPLNLSRLVCLFSVVAVVFAFDF